MRSTRSIGAHVGAIENAARAGINVHDYLHWSLDDYEMARRPGHGGDAVIGEPHLRTEVRVDRREREAVKMKQRCQSSYKCSGMIGSNCGSYRRALQVRHIERGGASARSSPSSASELFAVPPFAKDAPRAVTATLP